MDCPSTAVGRLVRTRTRRPLGNRGRARHVAIALCRHSMVAAQQRLSPQRARRGARVRGAAHDLACGRRAGQVAIGTGDASRARATATASVGVQPDTACRPRGRPITPRDWISGISYSFLLWKELGQSNALQRSRVRDHKKLQHQCIHRRKRHALPASAVVLEGGSVHVVTRIHANKSR